MPNITYPRTCPTCGKKLSKGRFFNHKKRCGTTEHRIQCPWCALTFGEKINMQCHVRQQHSNNPLRFHCTMCGKALASKQNLRLHMETVLGDKKPSFGCWYCNARFTMKKDRQIHMRCDHGRICREQELNLQLHLLHLSEENDIQNEWLFVESRPIQPDEHDVFPRGQTPIHSYFFMENKINGNRTFVGSTCIDPKAGAVIDYFKYILENKVERIYMDNQDNPDNQGLQTFTVRSNTKFVQQLPIVKHLNPPVIKKPEG